MENELGRNDKKIFIYCNFGELCCFVFNFFFKGEGLILVVLFGLICKVNRFIRKFEKEEYLVM